MSSPYQQNCCYPSLLLVPVLSHTSSPFIVHCHTTKHCSPLFTLFSLSWISGVQVAGGEQEWRTKVMLECLWTSEDLSWGNFHFHGIKEGALSCWQQGYPAGSAPVPVTRLFKCDNHNILDSKGLQYFDLYDQHKKNHFRVPTSKVVSSGSVVFGI